MHNPENGICNEFHQSEEESKDEADELRFVLHIVFLTPSDSRRGHAVRSLPGQPVKLGTAVRQPQND